ncbi:hypothetical protein, partial [Escherichia coli]|uniref:hypothetical protein n=1 Tax=Escherichia coli TaxID=562 RepID=UPI000BC712AE
EKPVPQGAAKGDYVTKTQPFSDLSFRPKKDLTGADMWGATMFDQLVCRNGELVVPAPEKPVPQGAAKGDYVTKTQPFSDLSFRPKKDLTG